MQNYYVHIFMCMYFFACLFLDVVATTTPPRAKEVAEEEEADNQVRRFFPESWLFDVVETK